MTTTTSMITTDSHPSWCDPARCLYPAKPLDSAAHRSAEQSFTIEGEHGGFTVSLELIHYAGSEATLFVDDGYCAAGDECAPDDLEALAAWLVARAEEYRAMLAR